jgi:hypothetical protein
MRSLSVARYVAIIYCLFLIVLLCAIEFQVSLPVLI